MLKDELDLDGRPNLNLASFVGTYMEREAEALMVENLSKNMSDADEYPAMMAMHARCVSIISHLWGVQKGETAIGSATTGSSEAIHLGGLAMKRRWQEKRDAEGKDKTKPNILYVFSEFIFPLWDQILSRETCLGSVHSVYMYQAQYSPSNRQY